MAVQSGLTQQNFPFVLSGATVAKDNETLLQDAGRATPLADKTLMAQVAASKKWVPWTDETAVDGTGVPRGIYVGDAVAAADLVAGDVAGAAILVGGDFAVIDTDQLVIENSLTLNTVIDAAAVGAMRAEDALALIGIFVKATVDIDELEN